MLDPTGMLRQFVDPAAVARAAAVFGIAPERTGVAVEALAPAFAAALRRRAADPRGLAEMMGFVRPKPDFAAALPGGEAIGRLFGSRELTRLVIDRIAETTGLDRRTLDIVAPLAGEAVMASFAEGLRAHPLTEALAPLFEPKPRAAPGLAEILSDTFGAETSRLVVGTLKGTPNPFGPGNPFGEIVGEFVRGFNNGGPPADEPGDAAPSPGVTVERLFAAHRDAGTEQARAFEAMFDRFWADAAAVARGGETGSGGAD